MSDDDPATVKCSNVIEDSLVQLVLQEIQSLGGSSVEIAERLALHGFKGTRGSCDDDPLVHFLTSSFLPHQGRIRFFISDVGVTVSGDGMWHELRLSPHVGQFVRELDEGLHPALEREPGRIAGVEEIVTERELPRRPALRLAVRQ